jgi:hypothetical protein
MTRCISPDGPRGVSLGNLVARAGSTLSAEIDGEVVALDIARGVCYGLDAVGSRVWAIIEQPTPVESVCRTLMAEYDVDAATCEADVLALLEDLSAEGLITVRDGVP